MHLEFYLLIISLPLPLKMNYQAHVKITTKNSFEKEPDLLKNFPPDPESPEVNSARKTVCSQNRFQEKSLKIFSLLSLDAGHTTATFHARKDSEMDEPPGTE